MNRVDEEGEVMKNTAEFEYKIGEHVTIDALGLAGRVDSFSFDSNGPMYRVIYWKNRERFREWLYPWELRPPVEQKDAVGHYV